MLTAAGHRDLVIGATQQQVQHAGLDNERRRLGIEASGTIELRGRPHLKPLGQLSSKASRISGCVERLAGKRARGQMLAMAIPRRPREYRYDDLRSILT